MTFLEFYLALLKFINFKLYKDLSLNYPAAIPVGEDGLLSSVDIQSLQKEARKKFTSGQEGDAGISEEFKNTPEMKKLSKKEDQMKKQRNIFSKCTFLLNREVPSYILQYLILSFGGSFTTNEDTKLKITHHIIDRPLAGIAQEANREYIQPQWIVDSLNNLHLLPTQTYKAGVPPPPHLSPFIDNVKEGYMPTRQREIQTLKGEDVDMPDSESEVEEVEAPVIEKKSKHSKEEKPSTKDQAPAKSTGDKKGSVPTKEEKQPAQQTKQTGKGDADSSSSEDSDDDAREHAKKVKNQKIKKELKKEQEELGKILMTKKQRQLLD